MDIKWEDPPITSGRGARVRPEEQDVIDALVARPGQWARLRDFDIESRSAASNLGATIRKGERAGWRSNSSGTFESCTRTLADQGVVAVYVRYVPRTERSDTD